MSADETATIGFGFGGEDPVQERQGLDIAGAGTSQATVGINSMYVDEDNPFDKMKYEDEFLLTNMANFFPELVWKKVFGRLEKKDDIDNCSNASPFFGQLLKEERARNVVLPKVFGILAQRYWDEKNNDESYKETSVESIPWKRPANTTEPHQMTALWKCRLVCKKWNEAIEEIHRNEDAGHYQMKEDLSKADNYKLGRKWGIERFSNESEIQMFLDKFEASHYDCVDGGILKRKCPLLGQSVRIYYPLRSEVERIQPFFDGLMKMLAKFGGGVSYFELSMLWDINPAESLADVYLKFKEMVQRMPNLKVLRVRRFDLLDEKEKREAFHTEIERNPFPKLAKLEMISLYEVYGPLGNLLVKENRHITRLEVGIVIHGACLVFTDNLPNLAQLSLTVSSVNTWEGFEGYPLRLKLTKFYLQFMHHVPFVAWSRVFSAIQAKCDSVSCTELVLKLPEPKIYGNRMWAVKESLECKLSLTRIERFHLDLHGRYCLDFMLPSKNSLKEIMLRCNTNYEVPRLDEFRYEQVIEFLGYEDKMQNSNIAKLLPRLKKLQVSTSEQGFISYLIDGSGVVKIGE